MRIFLVCVAGFAAVLAAAGYGGALHPAGDSLAGVRYPLVVVVLVCAVVLWRAFLAKLAVLVCLVLLGARVWMGQPGAPMALADYII